MDLFDLHCDTIEALAERKEDFAHSTTQFSLRDQSRLGRTVQVMAVWVPDRLRGREAEEFVKYHYDCLEKLAEKAPERTKVADCAAELDQIVAEGRWALVRSIESGAALGGDLENVAYFAGRHVAMMGLTWNGVNELGSGIQSDLGLTPFGKEVVRRMEREGMIVDCSHLNDAGFEDLLETASRPFVASHSNLRACCGHPRNLTDRQFRELVRRGGLCGLNLHSRFCSIPDRGGEGQREELLRHIDRMLELGGENIIAWGGDLDGGITCDPELGTPWGEASYGAYLEAHGISRAIVDKLRFGNAWRFFHDNWKSAADGADPSGRR